MRPAYNNAELLAWRLAEYFYKKSMDKNVFTHTGLQRAAGLKSTAWFEYRNGLRDGNAGTDVKCREQDDVIKRFIKSYRNMEYLFPYYYYIVLGIMPPDGNQVVLTEIMPPETFSEVISNAEMILHESVEERLVGGKVGDIMRAKVILGWQDEKTVKHSIGLSANEQDQRLKALGYVKTDKDK